MSDLFKRLVFWNLRVLGHVPGLKTYSKWLTKHYEKNFWRTYALAWASNLIPVLALIGWQKYQERRPPVVVLKTLDQALAEHNAQYN